MYSVRLSRHPNIRTHSVRITKLLYYSVLTGEKSVGSRPSAESPAQQWDNSTASIKIS